MAGLCRRQDAAQRTGTSPTLQMCTLHCSWATVVGFPLCQRYCTACRSERSSCHAARVWSSVGTHSPAASHSPQRSHRATLSWGPSALTPHGRPRRLSALNDLAWRPDWGPSQMHAACLARRYRTQAKRPSSRGTEAQSRHTAGGSRANAVGWDRLEGCPPDRINQERLTWSTERRGNSQPHWCYYLRSGRAR